MLKTSSAALSALGLLIIHLSGCGHAAPETADEPTLEAEEASLEAPATRDREPRGEERRRPLELVAQALAELDLSDTQRAEVDRLVASVEPPEGGPPRAFAAALAREVRSGKVVKENLAKELDATVAEASARRSSFTAAFQKLHQLLTPAQRVALATAVQEKAGEHRDGHDRTQERGGPKADGTADKHLRGPLGHLLRGVELTDAQRDRVRSALSDAGLEKKDRASKRAAMEDRREEMEAMWEAFQTPTFDASAALPERDPRVNLARLVEVAAAITPVLDATQRETFAKNLETAGPRKGRSGPPAR